MRPIGAGPRGILPNGKEDNPYQRATLLAKRLRVNVTADGATWRTPDGRWTYGLTLTGAWVVLDHADVIARGSTTPDSARLHVEQARNADPRRLAAAALLRHGATL